MTQTLSTLSRQLSERTGLSVSQSELVTRELLQIISENLQNGMRIEVRRFGVFRTVTRAGRVVQMPNGDVVVIPQRRNVVWEASKALKLSICGAQLSGHCGPPSPPEQRTESAQRQETCACP
jgi:nucleoid DNA-binding protein